MGTVLTVAQGRRLFGLISAGGIVGGVLGPAVASAALVFLPVKSLLLVSSFVFVAAIAALSLAHVTERAAEPGPRRHVPLTASLKAFREQPFLIRVAVVVFLSTATFLALDYLFKSTVARTMPSARVAPFIAHYYFGLNCVSLVVQLLLTGAVVRRLGMIPALVFTPLLLVVGAVVALLGGGISPERAVREGYRREPSVLDSPGDGRARLPSRATDGEAARQAAHRRGARPRVADRDRRSVARPRRDGIGRPAAAARSSWLRWRSRGWRRS